MPQIIDAIERLPIATLVHLFVAAVLGADIIVNGNLSTDALTYAAIVEGGNIGVGAARAHVAAARATAGAVPSDAPAVDEGPPALNAPAIPPEGEPTA